MSDIITKRLRLVPFTADMARMTQHDRHDLSMSLGANIPDAWPAPDFTDALPIFAARLTTSSDWSNWTRLIVLEAERTVIGDMGLHNWPDANGDVELGYSILPAYWNHGYATEAARALCAWVLAQPTVKRITAQCYVDNIGSRRVLEKIGMQPTASEWYELRALP
jgi:ribosomal-protein-alanine N-acetyltransferase